MKTQQSEIFLCRSCMGAAKKTQLTKAQGTCTHCGAEGEVYWIRTAALVDAPECPGGLSEAEMVRLAAEKCMGWNEAPCGLDVDGHFAIYPDGSLCTRERLSATAREWNPLTIEAHCGQLVNRIIQRFSVFSSEYDGTNEPGVWTCRVGVGHRRSTQILGQCQGDNRLRTETVACLRACGVKA